MYILIALNLHIYVCFVQYFLFYICMDALTDLHMCVFKQNFVHAVQISIQTHDAHQQTSDACARARGRISVLCMTLAGLEPAIFGSEDQRLIH